MLTNRELLGKMSEYSRNRVEEFRFEKVVTGLLQAVALSFT